MPLKSSNQSIMMEGVRILTQEAEALLSLAKDLNHDFIRAVDLMLKISGRVAVTGMGKSGHVARKTAATLASTGTPAYFVHPAEASHGDLGMISVTDLVLVYSNSGETGEIEAILTFCARHQTPVIGVTRNPDSFLGSQSTIVLKLPSVPEACPIGSAPTTSTTMMMALGDALALCLLTARGFTPEEFHQYHPGGNLGRKLLSVGLLMHTDQDIPLVHLKSPMAEVLCTMTGKHLGSTGVVDTQGFLVGIITDGDLRRNMNSDLMSLTAGDIMTANPVTLTPDTLAAQALGLMQQKAITTVFVVENTVPVGILHIHDCLRAGLQ